MQQFQRKIKKICFDNVRSRWICAKLIGTNEMIKNGSRFIQDDTLMMSVHLNEHFSERLLAETSSYNNNHWLEKESYAKAETDMKPVSLSSPQHYYNSNQSNIGGYCDIYRENVPESSFNARTSSTNTSNQIDNSKKRICDRNLNFVDNEYSDEEDVAQNSTNSSSTATGLISNLFSGIVHFFK